MPKSAGVSVESRDFSVFAGDTVQTTAFISNSGNTTEQFTFRIDGLAPDWYNLPVSSTTLLPHDEEELKLTLHPPKTDKIKAGRYAFRLIIDCQENPDDSGQVELSLEVKDVLEMKLQITLEHLSGNRWVYVITASNPGTTDIVVKLQLSGQDPLLHYDLHPTELTVPAGENAASTLEIKLRWQHFFHRRKNYNFTVIASQLDSDTIKTVSGQISKVPVKVHLPFRRSLSSGVRTHRQPPNISRFEAITEDQRRFNLNWSVENASEVKLDGASTKFQGEKEVYPTDVTSYVLTAMNKHGSVGRTARVEPLPIPKDKYSERILVLMTPKSIQVAAGGGPIEATVEIQNTGSIVDKFTLEIAGLPASWYSLSTSSVALMPHAKEQVQLFFHPPKIKGVTSYKYLFAVTLRSQSMAEESTSVTAQLEILPSVDYGISLRPYRAFCRRKYTFQLQVINKDVTEAHLFIDATDVENGLRFKLDDESPVVPPWQTVEIPMLVKPKRNSIIGDLKRYDINLTATTADGYTQLARGQIDHKPFLSSWRPVFRTLKYIVVFGAIGLVVYYVIHLGGGWSSLVRDPQRWLDGTIRHIRGWFY